MCHASCSAILPWFGISLTLAISTARTFELVSPLFPKTFGFNFGQVYDLVNIPIIATFVGDWDVSFAYLSRQIGLARQRTFGGF
jgi:hypothetical protein